MSMNFKVEGEKDKEKVADELDEVVDEYEEFEEVETSSSSSSKSDDKKGLVKLLSILLGVIIVFILVMFLLTSCTSGTKTYEEMEALMVEAAESYFADHNENLPKKDGGTQTIDVSVLVAEGYMKDLSKYNSAICTGTVKVQKSGSTYAYTPNLNCGESYASVELSDKIKDDNKIVSSGYGLYNKNGNYVFRGETVNNYVQLDNAVWRVVKITSSGNTVIILDEPLPMTSPYDNRYNEVANYKSGINNYSSSRLKEKLLEEYNKEESFLSDNDKAKTDTFNICSGARSLTETGVEQAVECKLQEQNQKVGLLTAADYMNASVDAGCTIVASKNCQNYNYLNGPKAEWWTLTPSKTNTYLAYMVSINNGIKETETYNYAALRPVVYLNSNVLYKSGTGTETDPYIVK